MWPEHSLQGRKMPNKQHIIPLLQQYKKHPSLWNPNDKNYKNHLHRTRILKSILHELGLNLTVGQLRLRLKNLRTTYVREINRIIESKKRCESFVYKPRLMWFDLADSFLRDVIAQRHRSNDSDSVQSIIEDTENDPTEQDHFEDSNTNASPNLELQQVESRGLETIIVKEENTTTLPFEPEYLEEEHVSNLGENQSSVTQDQFFGFNLKSSNDRQPMIAREDEFDTFGRHVGNQLRSLPLREAIKSQNFIHNYLTEVRLKFLDEKFS